VINSNDPVGRPAIRLSPVAEDGPYMSRGAPRLARWRGWSRRVLTVHTPCPRRGTHPPTWWSWAGPAKLAGRRMCGRDRPRRRWLGTPVSRGSPAMSDLIVIGYPDEHRAYDVWAEVRQACSTTTWWT